MGTCAVSQLARFGLAWDNADEVPVVVAELIFMIAGCLLGQVRTLQNIGYIANIAVWMNLFIIFMT